MNTTGVEKVIIVEGVTDKKQVEKVIAEQATVLCTHGTFDVERFDELLEYYALDDKDVYILVDEDEPGMKLRKQLLRELPHATNIHIHEGYKEVAETPVNVLATILVGYHFQVDPRYLLI